MMLTNFIWLAYAGLSIVICALAPKLMAAVIGFGIAYGGTKFLLRRRRQPAPQHRVVTQDVCDHVNDTTAKAGRVSWH